MRNTGDSTQAYSTAAFRGINFGWPCYEGIQFQPSYASVSSVETGNTDVLCDSPPSVEVPDDETPPLVHYHHFSPTISNPQGWTGDAATGGAFYTGGIYPATYHDRFFMIDYIEGWIRTIKTDAQDELVTWSDFGTDFSSPLTNIEPHPTHGDLYLVQTWSNAIWRLYYGTITDVDTPTLANRPFRIGSPSPNPSSGGVELPISLPEAAPVTLDVFQPDGRRVATHELESAPRGDSRVSWDGVGADGRAVAPGVYFVRLVTPWGADAKKLVIHER